MVTNRQFEAGERQQNGGDWRGMHSLGVDLTYLNPPFNSNAKYSAPVGSKAEGAEFKDTWGWDDLKRAWHSLILHDYPELSE